MKRVIYIGIAVVALGLASCSKQDIQPNSADPVVPVWKSNTGDNDPNGGSVVGDPGGSTITDPEIDKVGGEDITDPNIHD